MGCPTETPLEENLVFSITTHDPDTGVLTDADSAPTWRLYEDETGTPILTGTMAKLDDANTTGFYTELVACTAANGFETDKTYTIYIEATVGSDKGGISYAFKVRAANPNVNVNQWRGATPDILVSGKVATQPAGFATAAKAEIQQECEDAIDAKRLDELVIAARSNPVAGSFMDDILNKNGSMTFDPATDSLEAISDGGTVGPTAAAVADAVWDEAHDEHKSDGSFGKLLDHPVSKAGVSG